jgi:sugar phosphate isomerase/epimerase
LFAVHLSDGVRSRRFPPVYRSTPLGEGIVDVERDIRGAIEYGSDWLVGEVDHPPDPYESFESISETIHQRDEAD